MKYLIIGGLGFIGSHLCDYLKEYEVVVYDKLLPHRPKYPTFCDNLDFYIKQADTVYNLSGVLGTSSTFSRVQETIATNIAFSVSIMERCLEYNKPLVTMGMPGDKWLTPYSITKMATRRFTEMFRGMGLKVCTAIPTCVYGPRQKANHTEKLIPLVIHHCLYGIRIPICGDGEQVIDPISVGSVVRELAAIDFTKPEIPIRSGNLITVNAIVKQVMKQMDVDIPVYYIPSRRGEGLAEPCSEFVIDVPLSCGLTKTIAWCKENKGWLDFQWHSKFGTE